MLSRLTQHARLILWGGSVLAATLATPSFSMARDRPAVITQGRVMGDLWWHGELTDRAGNRWDIAILPGMKPSFKLSGESFSRSGERFTEYGHPHYWHEVAELSKDCWEFAGTDCLRDFVVTGIGEDYHDNNATIGHLASERPFGWIAQITWRTFWGYAIKPVSRAVLGPVGAVGGAAGGLLVPVGGVLYPPVVGVGDVAVMGVTVPVARIVWQQPAWVFCLFNNEPDESTDGSWGLTIIARPAGWQPPQSAKTPAADVATPLAVDQQRIRALAQELIRLEERLAQTKQRQHTTLLQINGFLGADGRPASLQLSSSAQVWLDTTAPAELEAWRRDALHRLGDHEDALPATSELLRQLRQASQMDTPVAAPAATARGEGSSERDERKN